MSKSKVYLDNNATTPLDVSVRTAIERSLDLWANPSSGNDNARRAASAILDARRHLATMFGAQEDNVVFTSGGTEANNWTIDGAIRKGKEKFEVPHVVTTNIEHPSITVPLRRRVADGGIAVTYVSVDQSSGAVTSSSILKALTPATCLVTIMLANNETGVLQPVAETFRLIRESIPCEDVPFLHSDVAQAAGKLSVNILELGADAVTVVGHKFYGPRNGALVFRETPTIPAMMLGGHQESGWRSGTENTPMIVGLGEAARIFNERAHVIEHDLRHKRDHFEALLEKRLEGSHTVHFARSPRLPNTSSVAFQDYPSHACDLLERCRTFDASTGAACHRNECSPILMACRVPFDVASKTVRFSFGRGTTLGDIERVVDELVELCAKKPEI